MLQKLHLHQLKRMIGLLKRRKYVYVLGLLGGMTGQISFIIVSAFIKKTMINAAINGQMLILLNSSYIVIIVIILGCIFDPLARYVSNWCIRKTMMELRLTLFSHIAKLPMTYFDNTHSGEIMARINNDLNVMERAYGWQMHMLLLSIIAGTSSLISMFILDWRLTIFMIIFGLASVLVNMFFASSLKNVSERIQVESSESILSFTNILTGLRTIKMFNIGVVMIQRFIDKNESLAKTQMHKIKKKSVMDSLNFTFNNLNLLGILLIGSIMVSNGLTDFGTILAIISLQTGLDFLLYQFSNYLVQYQQALAGANRVFELLDQSIEPEKYNITKSSCQKDMIVFKNVFFGYNDERLILNRLNLEIIKGEHIALVGSSGAGKSTIFKL
ncbi:MAG: ABC transporter ATP-binding protein/permease, partial [Desulfobacterales bacterium]|nr:ABC transporter ATP-binding protein/permease [Desulfobacterales bacterium]